MTADGRRFSDIFNGLVPVVIEGRIYLGELVVLVHFLWIRGPFWCDIFDIVLKYQSTANETLACSRKAMAGGLVWAEVNCSVFATSYLSTMKQTPCFPFVLVLPGTCKYRNIDAH